MVLSPRASVFLRFGLFAAVVILYTILTVDWSLASEWTQLFSELPLLLGAFALLERPLRRNVLRPFAAAAPLLFLYVLHDVLMVMRGALPEFQDVVMVGDLFVVLDMPKSLFLGTLMLAPFAFWLACVDWHLPKLKRRDLCWAAPVGLVAALFLLFPGLAYQGMNLLASDDEWSDLAAAEDFGRVYTALMRDARRRGFLRTLSGFTPLERSGVRLSDALIARIDRRNVHLILLESFLDVRLLRKVQFSRPPFDEAWREWTDAAVSSSVSPVFGGETARAEFELLCGVPSLRRFGVEFLAFSGARTYCLPEILRQAGYFNLLSFPYGPIFYNTRRAYPGLGFDQLMFADRFSAPGAESIPLPDGEYYLFDGDLFEGNLRKVEQLQKQGQPFLNYVVTMSGHWPFDIDTDRHPTIIEVEPDEPVLRRVTNLMYYRTRALFDYVQRLIALDPTGIIVLASDHLPPLEGVADYTRFGYAGRAGLSARFSELALHDNVVYAFVGGQPVKLPLMRHFDLQRWLLDQLTNGAYCATRVCDFGALPMDQDREIENYRTILGLAAR